MHVLNSNFQYWASLQLQRAFTAMPLPQDDTLPGGSTASKSQTTAPPSELSAAEVLDKFKALKEEAEVEGDEDDDEGDGQEEDDNAENVGNVDGDGKKKKKKKKKSKASKAVARLR